MSLRQVGRSRDVARCQRGSDPTVANTARPAQSTIAQHDGSVAISSCPQLLQQISKNFVMRGRIDGQMKVTMSAQLRVQVSCVWLPR